MPPREPSATPRCATAYGNWKAPAADGELLIWPEPAELLRDALDNGKRLRAAGARPASRTSRCPKSAGGCGSSSGMATTPSPSSPPATRPNCTTPASG